MIVKTKSRKITLGTKEWADSNVNCYLGCSNDCRYCYAKMMAFRFKRKNTKNWKHMVPNQKNIEKGYKKRKGRIMFPTSHDITDESFNNCMIVLRKLVNSKNKVLVTTKPMYKYIVKICNLFQNYKEFIQFRFTITSIDNSLLNFWEPGAPSFNERFNSLKFSFNRGFKTSISIEPFLDEDPFILVELLIPYVTESIWIGKMNYLSRQNLSEEEKNQYSRISEINSKENLRIILKKAEKYDLSYLRIKDSIINYLGNNS